MHARYRRIHNGPRWSRLSEHNTVAKKNMRF